MWNSSGFTLIEMIFVLSIVSILSLITCTVYVPKLSDQHILSIISNMIYEGKHNAINHKEQTIFDFKEDRLKISSNSYNNEYILPKGNTFNPYKFSYNNYGRIKVAKTVIFHGILKDYSIVFQLGSGNFYVKS